MEPTQLRPGLPARPADLAGEAAKLWDGVAVSFWELGTLTESTLPLLYAYCQAHAQFIEVSQKIHKEGLTIKYPSGYEKPHPLWKVEVRLLTEMSRLSSRLGMSPLSRARAKLTRAGRLDVTCPECGHMFVVPKEQ